MKKITLMLVAMLVAFAANAWTVKYANPNNWPHVYIWAWNGDGNCVPGGFPGPEMTGTDLLSYEGTGNAPTSMIISGRNDNGQEQGRIQVSYTGDGEYTSEGLVGAQKNQYTIYYENSTNWNDVYVYVWNNEVAGKWPGTKLAKNAAGLYEWTIEDTAEPTFDGLKFNNGNGSETAQFTYKAGATYNFDGLVSAEPEEYTVYIKEDVKWGKCYVYTFLPESYGAWPGTELTEKNEDGLYVWTIESKTVPSFGGVIFNNGEASDSPNKQQTIDLEYVVGKTYVVSEEFKGDLPGNLTVDYTGWRVYLNGEHNNWGNGEGNELGADPDAQGVASFDNVALGNSAFKIVMFDKTNYEWIGGPSSVALQTWVQLGEDNNMHIADAKAGEIFNVKFNCENKQLWVEAVGESTGVETVNVADGDAIYFNMQGVRVANPENGLFIRVQNGKAVKVVK